MLFRLSRFLKGTKYLVATRDGRVLLISDLLGSIKVYTFSRPACQSDKFMFRTIHSFP